MAKEKKEKKKSAFWSDFKAFINRGNVVDMAVGVIIGGAFGKIVTSLVSDIITPLISLVTGRVQLTDAAVVLREATLDGAGEVLVPESVWRYGQFIQNIMDFLIVAFFVFLIVRAIAKFRAMEEKRLAAKQPEEEPEPEPEPEPTKEELLLTEIRDLLKEKSGDK